jgi:hypothetical protein
MANESKTTKVKFEINGKEVTIDADSKLLAKLETLEKVSLQAQFADSRLSFKDSCKQAVDNQMDGIEAEALEGMTLIYKLDDNEPQLIESVKVKIMQRMPRATAEVTA